MKRTNRIGAILGCFSLLILGCAWATAPRQTAGPNVPQEEIVVVSLSKVASGFEVKVDRPSVAVNPDDHVRWQREPGSNFFFTVSFADDNPFTPEHGRKFESGDQKNQSWHGTKQQVRKGTPEKHYQYTVSVKVEGHACSADPEIIVPKPGGKDKH